MVKPSGCIGRLWFQILIESILFQYYNLSLDSVFFLALASGYTLKPLMDVSFPK